MPLTNIQSDWTFSAFSGPYNNYIILYCITQILYFAAWGVIYLYCLSWMTQLMRKVNFKGFPRTGGSTSPPKDVKETSLFRAYNCLLIRDVLTEDQVCGSV